VTGVEEKGPVAVFSDRLEVQGRNGILNENGNHFPPADFAKSQRNKFTQRMIGFNNPQAP